MMYVNKTTNTDNANEAKDSRKVATDGYNQLIQKNKLIN